VFQLGDSTILIFNKYGNCIFQTQKHDTSNQSEVQRVLQQKAIIINNRINFILQPSRVIGDLFLKKQFPFVFISEPEASVIPINQPMFLFAVTDGIDTDNLTEFQKYVKMVGGESHYRSSYFDKTDLIAIVLYSEIEDNKTLSFQSFT